ncbi:RNA polymerase sigma factor [Sporosarcina sp. G11-34]|uniref:RNA polymerase sigma factor n=1 Tax=Sporosarcina sp. G11-34 TaxID=2849605 RepID=UPI0022A8E4FB|nr:hypothetical protein [Sporosarcina sp. G11-34]MCZ2260441.1 hypothetical protein [Sporosarcina sp. G11-34]
MEDIKLIQNAKQGDFTGLGEWIDLHSGAIERFAFQYGLTLDVAHDLTLDTFRTFREELEDLDEHEPLIHVLYKLLINKLSQYQLSIRAPDDLFLFKEDEVLHSDIIQLNGENRVPFILSLFHGLDTEQIASITKSSTADVESNIQHAMELIGGDNLRKRLMLLEKSYDRLPLQFQATQILGTVSQAERPKKSKKKSVLWSIVAAVILMVCIVAIQNLFVSKSKQSAQGDGNDAFLTELEESYQAERDMRQEMLKLEDARFNRLNFIRVADEKMNKLKSSSSIENQSQRGEMAAEVKNIISELKLPDEMIEEIRGAQLNEDEKASIKYLSLYRGKVNDIITVYDGIIWDYREAIENYLQGSKTVDSLMLRFEETPEELQNITATMQDQSIRLCEKKNPREITACYYNSENHQHMENLLHHNAAGYVSMLTYDYYMTHKNLEYSPDWIANELQRVEQTVITAEKETDLYPLLESYYIRLFYSFVKSPEIVQMLDEQGSVPENHQNAWRRLFLYEEATPLGYLARPIYKEMEASGWRSSESWEQFNREKIEAAIKLARNGELDELVYSTTPKLENYVIELPDKKYDRKVEELYNEFNKSHDKTIFKDLSPIYVVGVFDYANEMENPGMMFNLFYEGVVRDRENGSVASLDSYLNNWRKGFSLLKDAGSIEYTGADLTRSGDNYQAEVKITHNNHSETYVSTLLDENQIWQMGETWLDDLPSYEETPPTNVAGVFTQETQIIYDYFAEMKDTAQSRWYSAVDIVRLFYYAAEVEDYETQYALYYQGKDSQIIEKERFLTDAGKNSGRKMEDLFETISFKANELDDNGNWTGVATLTVDLEKNPGEEPVRAIQMMWTDNGWRVIYDPMD